MIQRRTHAPPTAIGSFAILLGAGYAAPSARSCPRCGCRMSRYAGASERYCAPCATVIHPWQPPALRTRKLDECPGCGGFKQRTSKRCRKCADAGIRLNFTGHGFIK